MNRGLIFQYFYNNEKLIFVGNFILSINFLLGITFLLKNKYNNNVTNFYLIYFLMLYIYFCIISIFYKKYLF
jgi:hypothetical protein